MASTNLQTNVFLETADTIGVLFTNVWAYSPVVVVLTTNVETNLWHFSTVGFAGVLPEYNPSIISSMKRVYQNSTFPQFVIAGQGGADENQYTLSKKTTTQRFILWRSEVYNIGKDFDVEKIAFNLLTDLETGSSITPKLYFDNERDSSVGTTINSNNYSNTNKLIILTPKDFNNTTRGRHNFFLEFQFAGTSLAVVALPITIELDISTND